LLGSGFVADPGEEDHDGEEADADEDVGDVCGHGWVWVIGNGSYLLSRLKGSLLEPK
jgi:hypothetical protein